MKKLLFLFILLFIFPLTEVGRFSIGNGVTTTVNDIVVGLVGLFTLAFFRKEILSNKLILKAFLIFVSISVISLLVNLSWLALDDAVASSLYIVRWIAYGLIFFLTSIQSLTNKKKIEAVLVTTGIIIAVAGFFQYMFYNSLRNLYYLGWDEHMYRLFSTFLDPNFAGAFFVLFLLFVIGLFYKTKSKRVKYILLFVLFLTLVALFFTFSRSALIMFLVGTSVFFFKIGKKRLILVVFGILMTMIIIASPKFYVENINLFRIASAESRIATWKNAVAIIKENPLLGVGFNTYKFAQIKKGFRHKEQAMKSHADAGVDNSFLFILATTGIVGFSAYSYLWYRFLTKKTSKIDIDHYVAFSSTIALFVNALFINSLFYPFLMEWIWILWGISYINKTTGYK